MGKKIVKKLKCGICKYTFQSYRKTANLAFSQRSHRVKNKYCLQVQARLRRENREAGNEVDELNFDVGGDMMDFLESEEEEEEEEDNEEKEENDEVEEIESEEADDEHSQAGSEDTYEREKKQEEMDYDVDNDEEEDDDNPGGLAFVAASADANNPKDPKFWGDNPQESLIGVKVRKRWGNYGVFSGYVESYRSPYWKVIYSDNDSEELSLNEVLELIDVSQFNRTGGGAAIQVDESEDDEILRGIVIDRVRMDDSTESREGLILPDINREECEINDILKVQEILLSHYFDQRTSPFQFNKVNGKCVVDKVIALQMLKYIEENHMSREAADTYIKNQHAIMEQATGKPFNMVKSYKTLKRVFLLNVDKKIPLAYCDIALPEQFFGSIRTSANRPLPSLKAAYIPLEVTLATMLLKISPQNVVHTMKKEEFKEKDANGVEKVERIYTNWCSSKYACETQELIREGADNRIPLILYMSIFVDGGAMNSSMSRSATPVSIALQNVVNEKYQSLIGFVPEESSVSQEILDGLLVEQGINQTSRQYIMQHAGRQRVWDYLHGIITPFLEEQKQSGGFDVQIGTGIEKKYYTVFVVFTNYLADSPQMHLLAGVSTKSCHLCRCKSKNLANFRINNCDHKGEHGTIREVETPRDIKKQVHAGIVHMKEMSAFINKAEGANTRQGQERRKQAKKTLEKLNGYSGHNRAIKIFELLIQNGKANK